MSDHDSTKASPGLPPEHNRSLRGALSKYVTRPLSSEELHEVRDKAWAEAATEDWNRENKNSGRAQNPPDPGPGAPDPGLGLPDLHDRHPDLHQIAQTEV